MNKTFSAKILIMVMVVMLGGIAVFFQKENQNKSLTSDVLATIVTPAACYLQSDIDKKIEEKNVLVSAQTGSVQDIQASLGTIDLT